MTCASMMPSVWTPLQHCKLIVTGQYNNLVLVVDRSYSRFFSQKKSFIVDNFVLNSRVESLPAIKEYMESPNFIKSPIFGKEAIIKI